MSFNKFLQISIILLFCIFIPLKVGAVILYFEPSSGQYHQGDTFLIDLNIDTQGKCVNVIKVQLRFPQNILEGVDFSKGNSVLVFWLEEPVIKQDEGLISFTGGMPGGYCGILPGDPRKHSYLGKIAFRAIQGTEAKIEFLNTSQVLLNDGLGTPAKLIKKEAFFTILPEKRKVLKDEWQEKLTQDNIPPELFEIKIHQNPAIFDGKYFISFFTTDKQTGMNYFEIQEGRRNWKQAESPYLLEDQTLQSIIRVRAVDMAGNERIVELPPTRQLFPHWTIILIALALVAAGAAWWIVRKKKLMEINRNL
jgi:hypothetical protein